MKAGKIHKKALHKETCDKSRVTDYRVCSGEYSPSKAALSITLKYIIFGVAWILLSDRVLFFFPLNNEWLSILSMIKGWLYVSITGILLFTLIRKAFKRIYSTQRALLANYEELAITDQALQEKVEKLTESEERYRLVSEGTNDGIWDEKYGERYFSERWYEMTGYSKEDIEEIGDWMSLVHPEDIDNLRRKLQWHKENRNPYYSNEYRLKLKNGEYRWILSKSKLVFDEKGEIIRSAGSHTDITALKVSQKRLKELAYKDFLTDLPNRLSFYNDVKDHIANRPDRKKALIFFDIDNFKHINDTVGHLIGDQIIIGIGERVKDLIDSNKSAYRISGDEFVILIHEYKDVKEVEEFVEKLIKIISSPYQLTNYTLNITVSIGITLYPLHGKNVKSLFKNADIAMYKSKSHDRGSYTIYHESMNQVLQERMLIGNELRGALDRSEFQLYYQPQIDLNTGKICKLEALLRWKNDKLGWVPPLKFIEVAEETHLINSIGDWVISNACSFIKKLHNLGYIDIGLSINISIIQLMQQSFTDNLMETLKYYDLDPKYIELEVTETAYTKPYSSAREKLEALISKDVSIALDDFGTGPSSLRCLTQIPIKTIKIDKSFVDTIDMNAGNDSLIGMLIMLGHQLGLSVVAEGVETKEQLEYLKRYKCHKVQGFYFSKPMPQEGILNLLGS